MDHLQAIILAVIQGITEFLPISSSAHLILVPELLGWPVSGLAFDVAVHVGTLLAMIVFLNKEITQIVPAWFSGFVGLQWSQHGKLGWMVVVATIPVGLIGLFAGDFIEANLRTATVIAITTLVFGLLLGWADRSAASNKATLNELSYKDTLFVGLAQTLALLPGTSRSGITMTALIAIGYDRISAAKFSFLLALPAIGLSGLLKGYELSQSTGAVDWAQLGLAATVSATVAFICLKWFISFIAKVGFMPFVVYRIFLALLIWWVLV